MKKLLLTLLIAATFSCTKQYKPTEINIRSGVPLVQAVINDSLTWVLIDTGASTSVISSCLANGDIYEDGTITGIGGVLNAPLNNASFVIGDRWFESQCFVQDLGVLELVGRNAGVKVQGILGFKDIIKNKFYIDTRTNTLETFE